MTAAEFIAAYPAFSNFTAEVVQRHIDAAEPVFNVSLWGTSYATGLGLYVAHMLVMEQADARAMASPEGPLALPIKSKTNDTVSITWADMPANWWQRSSYGERYYRMVRFIGFGAIAV